MSYRVIKVYQLFFLSNKEGELLKEKVIMHFSDQVLNSLGYA